MVVTTKIKLQNSRYERQVVIMLNGETLFMSNLQEGNARGCGINIYKQSEPKYMSCKIQTQGCCMVWD